MEINDATVPTIRPSKPKKMKERKPSVYPRLLMGMMLSFGGLVGWTEHEETVRSTKVQETLMQDEQDRYQEDVNIKGELQEQARKAADEMAAFIADE